MPAAPEAEPGVTILVADDDPDLRDILRAILESAGFAVLEAEHGQQAWELIQQRTPQMVILDYVMPALSGPEVCERIRQDLLLRHTPIVMLTGKSETQDKVSGLNAGADDYLVKPFEPQELLARVQMVLRRTARELEANPLSKLPGNVSIQRELERRLAQGAPLAVCYVDLNRFKAFNDHYGFERGDEVIRRTVEVLLTASRTHGSPDDFVGHIGGDDFILLTRQDRAEALCEAIIRAFDAMAPFLYDEEDRRRGYLAHTDRQGQQIQVPLLSVSIALVTNERQPLTHLGQIARIAAELKAYAKQFDHSVYVKERRIT
jgi:diguanylate cyclase (GGDEF)-like protein